jgi:hypothetical protein
LNRGPHTTIDPRTYLRHVIERIAGHPINRIAKLLPCVVAYKLKPHWKEAPTPLAKWRP